MPLKPEELDELRPYHARYGITIGECLGIFKQPDPGAIPDEALQQGINIRITGSGRISSRGGQSVVTTTPLTGCVYGMIDVPTPEGVYAGKDSTWDTFQYLGGPGGGSYTRIFDGSSPFVINSSSLQGGARRNAVVFRGKVYMADQNSSKLFELVKDIDSTGTTLYSAQETVTLPRQPHNFAVASEVLPDGTVGEVLYAGSAGGTAGVVRWDGVSAVVDRSFAGFSPVYVCAAFNDVFAFDFGSGLVFRRAGGAWTQVTLPAGTTAFTPFCDQFFGNKLYIGGADINGAGRGGIISVDEFNVTAVARIPTIGPAERDCDFVSDMDIFSGVLVYAWSTLQAAPQGAPSPAVLGYFDTTFHDVGVNWTTLNAEGPQPVINSILNGDRTLYVMVEWDSTVTNATQTPWLFGIGDVTSGLTINAGNFAALVLADLDTLFGDTEAPGTLVVG